MTPLDLDTAPPAGAPMVIPAATSGLRRIDVSANPRIGIVMDMVGSLSQAHDPQHVLKAFAEGLAKLTGPRGYISLSVRGLRPGEYKITRMLVNPDDRIEDADPWRDWNSLPTHRGGLFGEIIRLNQPQLIHNLNLRDDPVIGDALAGYGSLIAVPLFENGAALNWSIQLRDEPDGFTERELEDAILRANLGGATVRNVMITQQLRQANQRIRGEIEEVARIQRALLPQRIPEVPGLSIAASYSTFDTAGGDMYDFAVVRERLAGVTDEPHDLLAALIADAAGHGPAAAVVSAMLNAILYTYPPTSDGPASVLTHANRHLCTKQLDGMFVTAFLASFHPPSRTLVYARAGHNPPLIKNPGSGGSVRRLDDVGGVPLGVTPEATYDNGRVVLEPGQTLVMYTDGIVEAMNPQREMFGIRGIERALTRCTGEPECVINSITEALREHEAGVRPADDQTIVAIKAL